MAEDEDRSEAFLATEKYVDNKTEGKYTLPEGGIPKSDLSPEVQTSLEKADTAAQKSTTLSGYGITDAHITNGVITLGENSITPLSAQVLSSYINGGSYDSTQKKILLKHDSTTVAEIDATAFIKDGMVSSAVIEDGNLVISFNTDAEQQPISVPLTSIFNPNNYYDIEAADRKFATKEELAKKRDLSDREFVHHHAGNWDFSPWQDIIPGEYKVEIIDNPVNSALVNFRATSADEWEYCGDGSLNQDGTELTISTQSADFMPLIGTPIVKADVIDSLALTSEMSRKADKAVPTAAGNFAGLDANGNLTDSRYAPGDFATTDALTTKINSVAIAPDFNATSPYAIGQHVTSEGLYYECKVVVPQPEAGTTNPLPKDDIWDAEHTTNHWIVVDVESMLRKNSADILIPVTWQGLVDLRADGDLVPGAQYRITDYVATTNGDMSSQSANHPFDIIVTADDERTLNEKARAIPHAGDTYFTTAGANLAAWEVWYCLDNDQNRFAWALAAGDIDSQTGTTGRGVVYRFIDEWRNDIPYDFKGIQFLAYGDSDGVYHYTFDSDTNGDASLMGSLQSISDNKINQYGEAESNRCRLTQIVFKNAYDCQSNTFGVGCYSNTFEGSCSSNTFGDDCRSNTFGGYCNSNTFGGYCQSNTFGGYCTSNTFGKSCYSNTFGNFCQSNTFGHGCSSNTFGNNCYSNTFGNNCYSNVFGDTYFSNTFGGYCQSNTFGGYCYSNTFGNFCQSNTFGHAWRSFSTATQYAVGDYVKRSGIFYKCTVGHQGVWDASHFVAESPALSYYRYITLESGVQNIALDCTATRGTGVYYQNVTVAKGVLGTANEPKRIEDSRYSQDYKTTYQPENSRVINI